MTSYFIEISSFIFSGYSLHVYMSVHQEFLDVKGSSTVISLISEVVLVSSTIVTTLFANNFIQLYSNF
jgi:hypothetical protein